jgi:hypothetical protein
MPAEAGVQIEKLADLRAEHLRHRLACRFRRATAYRPCAEAPGELDEQLV